MAGAVKEAKAGCKEGARGMFFQIQCVRNKERYKYNKDDPV